MKRPDTVGQPPFNVLGVLFLGAVSSAFLSSKKAYWAQQFTTWGLANSIRPFCCHSARYPQRKRGRRTCSPGKTLTVAQVRPRMHHTNRYPPCRGAHHETP